MNLLQVILDWIFPLHFFWVIFVGIFGMAILASVFLHRARNRDKRWYPLAFGLLALTLFDIGWVIYASSRTHEISKVVD